MPRPENPVDPADGPVASFAAELRELRRRAGGLGYRELARRAHYSPTTLAQAARGMTLPSLPVTLAYVRACGGNTEEWEPRWRAATAELAPRPRPGTEDDSPAPYVGLAAYGPDDAKWFCGRDQLIATLTERVARQRFVAVVGASGAGKSSVLRAGLVPAMCAAGDWTLVITPGEHPLEECAVRLGALLTVAPGQLSAEFVEDSRVLGLAVRQLMATRCEGAEFLLVVDQFEEVFTLCQAADDRDRFIAALLDAAHDADSRTRVVIGLRADFYAHCARHPRLVEALQDAQVLVGPMSTEELVEAITRPAARAGLMVEKTLTTTVVHEAAERPGTLPFVSHALWETWRRRHGNSLFLADYQATGGVNGAITQTADRLYDALDERQQATAKQILLRLTALGEGTEDTRRRVHRTGLGTDPTTDEVLDQLATARLITLTENTVEIAHEALIQGWPTLREWLTTDREKVRAHRRLTEAATEWDHHDRDEGYLYRGSVLATWQDHDPDTLNKLEQAFLAASTARQDRDRAARQRRLRMSLAGLGVIVAVMSVLAALAVVQATRTAQERDLAFSRQLAANARSQLQLDPELALLLAIEAVKVEPTAEADAVLRQAIVDSRVLTTLSTGGGSLMGNVTVSRNGRRMATSDGNGTVRVWEQSGGPWRTLMVLPGYVAALSADGRHLAGSSSNAVHVYDLDDGGDPVVLPVDRDDHVMALEFSPDGRVLAGSVIDGVRLWDPSGQRDPVLLDGGGAFDVTFSPDGRYLAGPDADNNIWIRDLTGQQPPVVLRTQPVVEPMMLSFSQDGHRLAAAYRDGSVRIWDPRGGEPVVLRGHWEAVRSVAFSPDGHTLAIGDQDGTIRLTNPDTGAEPLILRGHEGEVEDVAFSQDGRRLTSAGADGTLRIWDSTTPGDPVMQGHDGSASTAAFAPDGSYIVSGGHDGTVRVWNADGSDRAILRGHLAGVRDVDVSSDGRQIASIGTDGTVLIWNTTTGTVHRELSGPDREYVEFSPDRHHLATSGGSGTYRVWSIAEGTFVTVGSGDTARYDQVEFSPDGNRIAVATGDGDVKIRSTKDRGNPKVLSGHRSQVLAVGFSPDGRRLVSGGRDGTVRIWSLDSDTPPIILHGPKSGVRGVAFSPTGQQVVTTGQDRKVYLWNTSGGTEPTVYSGYPGNTTSATFSPDGRRLLTTHDDGTVRVQRCDVCGTTEQTLALAETRTTRRLTADERKTFGL
jgi:WD40 repeat protein